MFWERLRAGAGWDPWLLALTTLLIAIGIAELYSSSLTRPDLVPLFQRQLVALGIGWLVFVAASLVDYRAYRSWAPLGYVAAVALLVLVLALGHTIRGTTGWIRFGALNFQPVEAVKLLWVVALAAYLAHVGPPLTVRKTVTAGLLLLPLVGLVLAQPDFGSGMILVASWGAMLAAVPKPRRWWLAMGGLALAVLLVGGLSLKGYQRERLSSFLNPQADPLGSGYNVTQSVVAVGAGQWSGRGLGSGTQSQLRFLPEQHTDFIFAAVAEELGFVGGLLVLALWFGFFLRITWLLRRVRDDFAVLLVLGIASIFSVQVVLNIGMNLGLAPVVGVTLPFLSYGGSSLIVSLAAAGMLQNLARSCRGLAPYEAAR